MHAKRQRYDVLDGMRGVAAICVMVMHASGALGNSVIAVDLFFILSGFVIAHSYGARTDMGLEKFMRRRLIRLYPMFLLGMAFGWLSLESVRHVDGIAFSGREIAASVLTNALYLPYVAPHADAWSIPIFPANPPAWSLFFELVANLFFLPLSGASRRFKLLFVASSFAMIVVVGVLTALGEGRIGIATNAGWDPQNVIGGIPRVFFGFGCGILMYAFAQSGTFEGIGKIVGVVPGNIWLLFLFVVSIFAIVPTHGIGSLYYLFAIGVMCTAAIIIGSQLNPEGRIESAVCKFLGWLSYPIYCLHYPIIVLTRSLCGSFHGVPVSAAAAACLLAIVVAILATKFYEEPVRTWLGRRFLERPDYRASASVPNAASAYH